ncbi:MAG: hypothetical protein M0P31_13995 [Solirubrobacteraceae bacterium]|nr:hypothetical protein [Solirubrobacteraceae bacterium]
MTGDHPTIPMTADVIWRAIHDGFGEPISRPEADVAGAAVHALWWPLVEELEDRLTAAEARNRRLEQALNWVRRQWHREEARADRMAEALREIADHGPANEPGDPCYEVAQFAAATAALTPGGQER